MQRNNNYKSSSADAATNLQPVALPDSEYNQLRNVVAGLLVLQLTDKHEVMKSKNTDTCMSTGSGGGTN